MSPPDVLERSGPLGADSAGASCPHCGTPVEGAEDSFCCHGCELAFAIIRGAGLDRYYAERDRPAPRPEPLRANWRAVEPEPGADGTCSLRLAVDGFRCASCVWVTENVLQRTAGIEEVTVSYATGRTSLRWNPDKVNLTEIASKIASLGYRPRLLAEEGSPDRGLMVRLGVATFAACNVMMFAAAVYAGWLGAMAPRFESLFAWGSLLLATPVAIWCAEPFFRGAWSGLRHGILHMDVPIALAITVLYVHGVAGTLMGFEAYLDSLTMLVALLLAGRVLESRGRRRAADAALALAGHVPTSARRIVPGPDGDRIEEVAAEELATDDRIEVGSGGEFAADGVVLEGRGFVRMALLTGEAEPVEVGPGDRVFAGTVLVDGAVVLRVTGAREGTVVHQMAVELEEAAARDEAGTTADRIAPWFTLGTIVVATACFAAWTLTAGVAAAIPVTVAVLVVACPCALALSRPLAASAGLGAAARRGLLLRSTDALLDLAEADDVVLDKTGTVTGGALEVLSADDHDLRVAAGLERFSVHPIAEAILKEAASRGIPLPKGEDVVEVPGEGIEGRVDGRRWTLRAGLGSGVVVLEGEGGYRGLIRLGDRIRPDSANAIAKLRAAGLGIVLLSGDRREAVESVADDAGISIAHAGLRPDAKVQWIRERQGPGRAVVFAGDGLNDGPALAEARVGIAMGSGAASSVLAADGIVASGSLGSIVAGIAAGRAAQRTIRGNQIRSIVYNVSAVAAAAVGWVNPLVAAVLMPLSSALVLWRSSRVEAVVATEERAAA